MCILQCCKRNMYVSVLLLQVIQVAHILYQTISRRVS